MSGWLVLVIILCVGIAAVSIANGQGPNDRGY